MFEYWKETFLLRAFSLLKIPMLFFISPTVEAIDDNHCTIRIPLSFRTRNHIGSMYFGVLAAGADCAGGLIAMYFIRKLGSRIGMVFKDFKADFLKRAEGDTFFTCLDGEKVRNAVIEAGERDIRVDVPVHITATVPSKLGDDPVARFELTLSLRRNK
jgi:acyl-coenzyme A thioesterase PaaI-like protein